MSFPGSTAPKIEMGIHSEVLRLGAGAFFGEPCQTIATPSFQFSELRATVPERQVPRHAHEMPHMILVLGGVYVTEARNQPGACFSGTLIFNPSGTTHRDCFRSREGKFLSISPGPETSRLLSGASPVPLIVAAPGVHALDGSSVSTRIVSEMRRGPESSALVLEGLGLELTWLLLGLQEGTSARFAPRWLMQVKEMIEDCVSSDLSIAELAASAGVHPVYLARAYRRFFGCTPGEYLRCRRLNRVQGLLSATDLPLVQIALQCGFSDQSQMTRSFTLGFGTSPARYRRLRRQ